MRAMRWLAVTVVLVSCVLAGCGKDDKNGKGAGGSSSGPPAAGKTPRETLTLLCKGDPDLFAACLDVDEATRDLARDTMRAWRAARDLNQAVERTYGKEEFVSAHCLNDARLGLGEGKTVEDITIDQQADRAECRVPGRDDPIVLVRKEGLWYYHPSGIPDGAEADKLRERYRTLRSGVESALAKVGSPGYGPARIKAEASSEVKDFLWPAVSVAAARRPPDVKRPGNTVPRGTTAPGGREIRPAPGSTRGPRPEPDRPAPVAPRPRPRPVEVGPAPGSGDDESARLALKLAVLRYEFDRLATTDKSVLDKVVYVVKDDKHTKQILAKLRGRKPKVTDGVPAKKDSRTGKYVLSPFRQLKVSIDKLQGDRASVTIAEVSNRRTGRPTVTAWSRSWRKTAGQWKPAK